MRIYDGTISLHTNTFLSMAFRHEVFLFFYNRGGTLPLRFLSRFSHKFLPLAISFMALDAMRLHKCISCANTEYNGRNMISLIHYILKSSFSNPAIFQGFQQEKINLARLNILLKFINETKFNK